MVDLDDLARGLVSGVLTEQVSARGKGVQKVGLAAGALALIVAVIASGWLRWLLVFVALVAVGIAIAAWVARKLAVRAIHRFAEPKDLAQHRSAISAAIDDADLPTGPIAVLGLLWRLRKGVGPEVDRVRAIVSRLKTQLDTS